MRRSGARWSHLSVVSDRARRGSSWRDRPSLTFLRSAGGNDLGEGLLGDHEREDHPQATLPYDRSRFGVASDVRRQLPRRVRTSHLFRDASAAGSI